MKELLLLSTLALSVVLFSCGGSSEEKKQNDGVVPDTTHGVSASTHDALSTDSTALVYICPCGGCPEVKESKPGKCPKCEMDLAEQKH